MNWLCRIGLHRDVCTEMTLRYTARSCGVCGKWLDPAMGALVEADRAGILEGLDDELADLLGEEGETL